MADFIAAPDRDRNKNNSGPAKDCAEYNRDCACWRCLRHFHLRLPISNSECCVSTAPKIVAVFMPASEIGRQHDRRSISYQLSPCRKTNA